LDKYDLDVKQPHPEGSHEIPKVGILDEDDELEPGTLDVVASAKHEEAISAEFDTVKYQETYSILDRASNLMINSFAVGEDRDELVKKLQETIKSLTTLLLKLESDINE